MRINHRMALRMNKSFSYLTARTGGIQRKQLVQLLYEYHSHYGRVLSGSQGRRVGGRSRRVAKIPQQSGAEIIRYTAILPNKMASGGQNQARF